MKIKDLKVLIADLPDDMEVVKERLVEAEARVQKLRACLEQMDPFTLSAGDLASKADVESACDQEDYRDRVLAETL